MTASALLIVLQAVAPTLVRGTVADAVTGAPVAAVEARAPRSVGISDQRGRFALRAGRGDTVRVRRIGYRTSVVVVDSTDLLVRLEPLAIRLADLDARDTASVGRVHARVAVRTLERGAAVSIGEALSHLPFVTPRSSRGALTVSMRGSRPEQVAVLLDGVPLNDPATGVADISDIPLAALGSLSVTPGSAVAAAGLGAGGGVLSLQSGGGSTARAAVGAYGRVVAGGAHALAAGRVVLRAGGEWSSARNDFPFVNTVAARDTVERRVNSDEHRLSLYTTVGTPSARAILLLSSTERGLVGPMNVHVYDAARGHTRRALAGATGTYAGLTASAAVRALELRYRHPGYPGSLALSLSGDAELGGRVRGLLLRVGAGADRVTATGLRDELRPRAFAALDRPVARGRLRGALGVRADIIRDGGAHVSPAVALERRGLVTLFARAAQAFRAPTFYDLYVVGPQWLSPARTLAPERVVFDGEIGARMARGAVALTAALFERKTRDAIVWFPGTLLWSPKNVPSERARGAELRASVVAARAEVDAWGSLRSARLLVDGLGVAGAYVPVADGGASARARTGRLEVSAALSAIGRRPIALVPRRSPQTELPPVVLADAALTWRVPIRGAAADVTAGVHNLGDVHWQAIDRYPSPGRSWTVSLTINP